MFFNLDHHFMYSEGLNKIWRVLTHIPLEVSVAQKKVPETCHTFLEISQCIVLEIVIS